MARPNGYYWVQFQGAPEVARWNEREDAFEIVGERTLVAEKWARVLAGPLEPPKEFSDAANL